MAQRRKVFHRDASASLRWKKSPNVPNVWVSSPSTVRTEDYGHFRTHHVHFRIDGRQKTREGYRIDKATMMGWEAIDRSQGAPNLSSAKKLVQDWLAAANEQRTLHPRGSSYGRDPRRSQRSRSPSPARDSSRAELQKAIRQDQRALQRYKADLTKIQRGGRVPNLTAAGARHTIQGLRRAIANKRKLLSSRVGRGR